MPLRLLAVVVARTLLPPLALCLALLIANKSGYWSRSISAYQADLDEEHASAAVGCGQGYVPVDFAGSKCSFNELASGRAVYLIGDSNADHLSEALMGAAKQTGRPLRFLTKGGCAFLGRSWSDTTENEQTLCNSFVDSTLALVKRSPPGIVILGVSDSVFYAVGRFAVGATKETRSADRKIALAYLESDLLRLVSTLQDAGHVTIIVKPVPKFVTDDGVRVLFDPAGCTTVGVIHGTCPKRVALGIDHVDVLQSDMRISIDRVAKATNAKVIDLRSAFCSQDLCDNVDEIGIQYKNAGHLTTRASSSLSYLFVPLLKDE